MHAQPQRGRTDRDIGALAERQHGVVSRAQLLALGFGTGAIKHRVEIGRLQPVYRGVYTVGHRLVTRQGRWMAAVLASGPGAVLSHRAAAALWNIRGGSAVEVTVRTARHRRRGIRLHRATLPDDERTTHRGIPTTTVPRTLLDLSAVASRDELRSAMRQAETQRLADALTLGDLIERYPRRPGIAAARAIAEEARQGMGVVRSELEERFQALLLSAAFPPPVTNCVIEGYEVDCAWPRRRVVVELDGRSTHANGYAFEADRERDRALAAKGWRVVRITWRQLEETEDQLKRDLTALLRG